MNEAFNVGFTLGVVGGAVFALILVGFACLASSKPADDDDDNDKESTPTPPPIFEASSESVAITLATALGVPLVGTTSIVLRLDVDRVPILEVTRHVTKGEFLTLAEVVELYELHRKADPS